MRNLLFVLSLIISIGLSAQNTGNGTKAQKSKYPKKSLQANPKTDISPKSVIFPFEQPSSQKSVLTNRKPGRTNEIKGNAESLKPEIKSSGKSLTAIKKSNSRSEGISSATLNQSTLKTAVKQKLINPNKYKNTTNVTILDEDFDTWPPTSWTISSGTSSTATADGKWHSGTGASGATGDNAAEVLYNSGLMSDEWMVTPTVSLPSSATIKMSFDWLGSYYWHVSPNDGADNPILISTNGGTTWQTSPLWQEDDSTQVIASGVAWPWTSFTWYSSEIDLSSYAGQSNVKIAFRYIGNDGAQWNIDNVHIFQETTTTVAGDNCTNATVISGALPITGTGTGIENYNDDYSAILTTPWGYFGPDMVYSYTSTVTGDVSITFDCNYDNVIAVFTSCTSPGTTQVVEADINYNSPFTETVTFAATTGATYYIVNAAYEATATGGWTYTIESFVPCVDNLVTVGSSEIEPNGGLNETPVQYDPRAVGTPASPTQITGNYYTVGDTIRDMDWFNFTITTEMIITGTVDVACTNPILFIVSDSIDALGNFLYYFDADVNGPEMGETLTTTALPAGDYWFVVAPNSFAGIPTPVNYNATLYGEATGTVLAGETCSNAIQLTGALPITGTGTGIENYSDDYSTVLTTPWGYTGPDVVYSFTPSASGDIDITFDCDFDNIIAVFTDCLDPATSQIDATDDNFNAPFFETTTISVTAGTTYYILNSAYEAIATGDWTYTLESSTPCVDNLVPVGSSEIEPNGGLNELPVEYDPRAVGTPLMPTLITGNYFTVGDTLRDMDWFNFTLTQEMIITGTVDVACTDPIIFIVSDSIDALGNFLYYFDADLNGPETGEILTTTALPAGDYWFVVAPNTFAGINTPVNYNATLSGEATGATQYLYFEDFQNGMPTDITLYNLDGLTPAANVASYTEAWNIIENFDLVGDSVAASNSWYSPPGTANDWLVTPAITIGNDAFLEWDIKAQDASYPDGYQVKISTTGPTVASFTTTVYTIAAANAYWETISLNLDALGFSNTTIWIAFVNNSTDMFLLLLDDIKVYVPNTTDVAIQDPYFTPMADFTIIPLDQAGFTFGATAANVGTGSLSNITFNVDVLGNAYNESTVIPSLASGATSPAAIATPFSPTSMDTYDVYYTMDVAGDAIVSNNEALISIEISDTVLARDNGLPAGGVGFSGGTGHFGNVFEIVNPTTLTSVSAYFSSAETWETFSFSLFENYNYTTNTVGLPMFTSPVFTKTTAMAGAWNTFEVPSTSLTAGNYLLVINQLDTTNISLGYDDEPGGFLIYYTTTPDTLTLTNSFGNNCLRMNFGPQYGAPNWTYTNTGNNHTILVNSIIPVTIDGVPVEVGDYLGVFFDQGGVQSCGGYAMYTGNSIAVTAWGAQTGFDDGFQSNEPFSWRIWDASTGIEYDATASYNTLDFPNGGTYVVNGMSGLYSLIALTVEIQTIILPGTWSIFSTYINPFEPAIDSVFSAIASQVQLVKNGNGQVYWPLYGVNAIGNLVIGEGYQVKCSSTQLLEVEGLSVDPVNTVLNIQIGWSIMAYLHQTPADIAAMMSSIVTEILIMKSGAGQVYWPQYGVNGIGNMMPGEGYQIKLNSAQSFSFPAITPSSKVTNQEKPVYFENSINTGNNMTIGFPESILISELEPGDEIAAFNSNGELVGSGIFSKGSFALTVWGQDETDLSNIGIADGEEISFSIWNKRTGTEFVLVVNSWYEGDGFYQKDGISVANDIEVHKIDQLHQNHPNPFNNTTEISFTISEAGKVEIELYDVLGTKLGVILSDNFTKGNHSIEFDGSNFASGSYFYRIVNKHITETKSMTIQK